MDLDKAIQKTVNVKKFKDKKPDWKDIIECINAARFTSMAGNNYTLKFILVDDKEKIQKITSATQQPFVSSAHYLVVICSDPKRTINMYENRGKIYFRQQAGAGIQNFLLKLEEYGLSTYWVRLFVDRIVKKELDIPEGIEVEGIFPIGYEFEKKRTRDAPIDLDRILYFNSYDNKKMNKIKKLSA